MIKLDDFKFLGHDLQTSDEYINFIFIQRVRTRATPSPHQPATRGDATVSMAKAVLSPLAPPAAFATGQGINTERKFLFVV